MHLRNRDGTAVDAVPFSVVAALAFAGCFSFGPPYCRALGIAGPGAVGLPAATCLAVVGAAYYRLVHTARPDLRAEIPPGRRIQALVYASLVGTALLVALALPLLVA